MRFFWITILFFFTALAVLALILYLQIPSPAEIKGCLVTKMYQVNLCPGSKNYTPLKQISNYLQKAVVLSEDSLFFQHKGFDWESLEKSARENWQTGKFKRGGSTITQQLSKNMFLSKDKTITRKAVEALITMQIEKTLKKNEILERYLNVIEFGKDIYGVKAAAQYYFKKTPAQLNVAESAFLVMILPNPIKYSRSFIKKDLSPFAKKRISRIINDMYQYNRISKDEYDVAMIDFENFFGPAPTDMKNTPADDLEKDAFEEFEN